MTIQRRLLTGMSLASFVVLGVALRLNQNRVNPAASIGSVSDRVKVGETDSRAMDLMYPSSTVSGADVVSRVTTTDVLEPSGKRVTPSQVLFSGWCGVGTLTEFSVRDFATRDGTSSTAGELPLADLRGPIGIVTIDVQRWIYGDDSAPQQSKVLGLVENYSVEGYGNLKDQVGRRGVFVYRNTPLDPSDGIGRQRFQLVADLALATPSNVDGAVDGGMIHYWFPEQNHGRFGPIGGRLYSISDIEELLVRSQAIAP